VKQFLVEVFSPRSSGAALATAEHRMRLAARDVSTTDREVRYVRATYVPEDEICFFVIDAGSEVDAALVTQRAGLDPIRVVEAVSSEKEER
jgi:hypothetical protein